MGQPKDFCFPEWPHFAAYYPTDSCTSWQKARGIFQYFSVLKTSSPVCIVWSKSEVQPYLSGPPANTSMCFISNWCNSFCWSGDNACTGKDNCWSSNVDRKAHSASTTGQDVNFRTVDTSAIVSWAYSWIGVIPRMTIWVSTFPQSTTKFWLTAILSLSLDHAVGSIITVLPGFFLFLPPTGSGQTISCHGSIFSIWWGGNINTPPFCLLGILHLLGLISIGHILELGLCTLIPRVCCWTYGSFL